MVARHGRLNAAARELNMSPSTLSGHIKEAESELGGVLFERGRVFEPTAAGDVVLGIAQRMLADYAEMRRACVGVTRPPLTLRVPNYTFGQMPFLSVRDAFETAHPGLTVAFHSVELEMEDALAILKDRSADVACIYTAVGSGPLIQELVPEGFETFCAGTRQLLFYTRPGDRLSGKEVLDPEDLDGGTVVVTLCRLCEIAWPAVTERLANYGARVSLSYRRMGRHEDVVTQKLSDELVPRMEGYELPDVPMYSSMEKHRLSFDLRVAFNLVYIPECLTPLQLEYVTFMRDAARRSSLV